MIKEELAEVRGKYADERRTELTVDVGDLDVLDLIDDEEVIVVLSTKGYIKTVAADAFRRQGRSVGEACGAATCATRTSSPTCSPRPHTSTCCSSQTAGSRIGCVRTRSR